MNIIKKARISADKRSVDAYGRSIELAIANYLLDEVKFPTDISQLTIEYTGDEVTYNNVDYYVIKDSFSSEDSVTLLKAEPLTIEEVNQYGAGHANRYTSSSVGTAYDSNCYGGRHTIQVQLVINGETQVDVQLIMQIVKSNM